MNYTFVGLFLSQDQSEQISDSLSMRGFSNSDYIIYRTQTKKMPLWERIFSTQHHSKTASDSLLVSVAIRSGKDLELAHEAFRENHALHTYALQDVDFMDAKNLDYLKKVMELKAKIHIYSLPEVKVSNFEVHSGMNTEIKYNFTEEAH